MCPPIQEDDDDFVDPPQRKKAGEGYNSDSMKFFLIHLLPPNVSFISLVLIQSGIF